MFLTTMWVEAFDLWLSAQIISFLIAVPSALRMQKELSSEAVIQNAEVGHL